MIVKRLTAWLLIAALLGCLTACGEKSTTSATTAGSGTTTTSQTGMTFGTGFTTYSGTRPTVALPERDENAETAYPDKAVGFQMELPAVGEQIAIVHTSEGDMYIRLFPEAAPKAVSNFIALAQSGYYNGLTFHYVKQHFIVQSGDPTGTGGGGASATGEPFKDEFDTKLLNLYGAVAMASDKEDSNGSQFYINQKSAEYFGSRDTYTPEYREQAAKAMYESALEQTQLTPEEFAKQYGIAKWEDFITETYVYDWIPEEVWDVYLKHGGNLHLDGAFRRSGGHTVFGQVFKGLETLEAIAGAVVNSDMKPLVDITITSVEITTYQG